MTILKRLFCAFLIPALTLTHAVARDYFVYFGTFTNATSKGIYVSRLNAETGAITAPQLAAETPSPNFLAVSANQKFLYAATRLTTFEGKTAGAVSAFVINPTNGTLSLLNQKSSGDAGPCYVSVDAAGKTLFVANYNGGSVKSIALKADGSLGADGTFIKLKSASADTNSPIVPHAHWMSADPSGRFALACDLGDDRVMIYRLDPATAALKPNDPAFVALPPGAGVRHLAFSPDGKFAYTVNQTACSVTTFAWDSATGKLESRATVSLLPADVAVQPSFTAAEILAHPSGKFVYVTVRGSESISVLAVDASSGKLALVENVPCWGAVPRGCGIDPGGRWLICANQDSGNAVLFAINAETGRLSHAGPEMPVSSPVDVKFAEAK